jgi:hypothetical protein
MGEVASEAAGEGALLPARGIFDPRSDESASALLIIRYPLSPSFLLDPPFLLSLPISNHYEARGHSAEVREVSDARHGLGNS